MFGLQSIKTINETAVRRARGELPTAPSDAKQAARKARAEKIAEGHRRARA